LSAGRDSSRSTKVESDGCEIDKSVKQDLHTSESLYSDVHCVAVTKYGYAMWSLRRSAFNAGNTRPTINVAYLGTLLHDFGFDRRRFNLRGNYVYIVKVTISDCVDGELRKFTNL
jgi:hypothetical protein